MTGARSGRQLVALVSTHGKTEDELVEEVMRAWTAWRERAKAQAKAEVEQGHDTPDGGTPPF